MRARVLAEIGRIARENGGAPPGMLQFASKSGIRKSAWVGRIWPRWSDALKEAGFAPHPANPRLNDDDMLAAIAEAARAIGRIPAENDLVFQRAAGRRIPCHQTYLHHFGGKEGTLLRLKRWAEATPERADVAAMLAGVEEPPVPAMRCKGTVYLLRCGRWFKIGCSTMVRERVRVLQQGLPEAARLVHVIHTDDPHGIESYWHRRFAKKRVRGEWFRLSRDDVAVFRQRKFQ